MNPPTEKQAASEIDDLLADLLGNGPARIHLRESGAPHVYDYPNAVGGNRFLVEYKSSASTGPLATAVDHLRRYAESQQGGGLPIIVVPFMGEVGRELCDKFGVSWLDLSGNAKIIGPGLMIRIEGLPNKYGDRGRPPNAFAPKSSRIARHLLLQPEQFQTQAELAHQTGLGDGYVSRIVRRLAQEQLIDVNERGAVRARDPNLLLDTWRQAYDFNHHSIIKGHVPARSGDELLNRIAKQFAHENLTYATTGLAAAWLFTSFAAFRLATLYVESMPSRSLLKEIEFSDEPKGANLWLVLPDDQDVFEGSQERAGFQCVSPVQTYLDLKGQPERAKEAAAELRRTLLHWEQHGK
jgi:hypothetical protein